MIGKERMGGKRVNSGKECREKGKEEREGKDMLIEGRKV